MNFVFISCHIKYNGTAPSSTFHTVSGKAEPGFVKYLEIIQAVVCRWCWAESLSADSRMGRWESCLLSFSHVKTWSRCKPVHCNGIFLLSEEHRSSHHLVIKFDPQLIAKLLDKHIPGCWTPAAVIFMNASPLLPKGCGLTFFLSSPVRKRRKTWVTLFLLEYKLPSFGV